MTELAEGQLRDLARLALGGLVRRGADFGAAEDAVQEALIEAAAHWPETGVPDEPAAWLTTVARRKLIDTQRADAARRRREQTTAAERPPGPSEQVDDTLQLLFLCCHPALTPPAAVALTLRAVGGLSTREIAAAYLLPEATIAQRITRAKRVIAEQEHLDQPGTVSLVLQVLYLIFNEGYTAGASRVDLAAEAIRLTRLLHHACPDPEVAGLLALMLLHHARRPARFDEAGTLVPLEEQDRSVWNTEMITEAVRVLSEALAQQRRGEYQMQAAIAALHDDAATVEETDWPQILEWYDELVTLTGNPLAMLSRAVAVGEVAGPLAGLRAIDDIEERLVDYHRMHAVRAHLHERAGHHAEAAALFAQAAAKAPSTAERNHLLRRAARARSLT
jgi:RNA polymerase sigma factor (sigma-70 family)